MELNPKFKLSYNEMCKFQQDCENAVTRCPRYLGYWGFSIDSIYDGHVSAKDLVERWLECYTLWDVGYHLYLSKETLGIIKKYTQDLYHSERLVKWHRFHMLIGISFLIIPGFIEAAMLGEFSVDNILRGVFWGGQQHQYLCRQQYQQ
jgi:hypothetical protein